MEWKNKNTISLQWCVLDVKQQLKDRGKKEKVTSELLTTHMHLKSYGQEKGFVIDKVGSYIISVFGKELMSPRWRNFSINGLKALDEHLNINISNEVNKSIQYYITRLEHHVENFKIPE